MQFVFFLILMGLCVKGCWNFMSILANSSDKTDYTTFMVTVYFGVFSIFFLGSVVLYILNVMFSMRKRLIFFISQLFFIFCSHLLTSMKNNPQQYLIFIMLFCFMLYVILMIFWN